MSPAERTMRARLAAHVQWSKTPDPTARTAAARRAFLDRFEVEVDPDGTLPPEERHRRAEHARRAHFTRLALASARARRRTRHEATRKDSAASEPSDTSPTPGGEAA